MIARTAICLLFAASTALTNPNMVFILVDDMGWTGTSLEMGARENNGTSKTEG